MKKRTPALDGFCDGRKVPRFRDDGTGDGLFDGWDDERLVDGEAEVAVFR